MTRDRSGTWVGLAALIVFLPSLTAGFVLDDKHLIVDNPFIQNLSHVGRALSTHLWDVPTVEQTPELLHYYRPTVSLSYMLDFALGDGRPLVFHLTNVLLHVQAVVLAFAVGRRWLDSSAAAAFAALIFALHPTRTESVVWVSGRPDLLATVCLLAWLQLTWRARDEKQRSWALPLSVLALCCSLLSKETAVAAPILLLVETAVAPARVRPSVWRSCGLAAGVVALYLTARALWLPIGGEALSLTPQHALVTVLHYAERALLPWPQTFYFRMLQGHAGMPSFSTLECSLGAGVALVYLVTCARLACRRPVAAACLLCAAAFLGPLVNLTKTGSPFTTCDRFLYLPLWLLAVGLVDATRTRFEGGLRRPAVRLALAATVLLCAAVDIVRCLDFRSPSSFWSAEIAANPHNPVARSNRASLRADAGDTPGALGDLDVVLSPAARRYVTLADPERQINAYLLQLRLQAEQLPDGAAQDLDVIALEMLRVLAAEPKAEAKKVGSIRTGYELDATTAAWITQRGIAQVARSAVVVLSRLERHQVTVQVLDLISDAELLRAPEPLGIVLAEARERRFASARRRLAFLAAAGGSRPGAIAEVRDLESRIASAEAAFDSARGAADEERARVARANGYARLGAPYRALLELHPIPNAAQETMLLRSQLMAAAGLGDRAPTPAPARSGR